MPANSIPSTQNRTGKSRLMGSTNDLAADAPASRLDQVLQWVPRILSSKPHVIALMGLGIYLILLPLIGVTVSAAAELIGGNYTNVTSDIAASIAAGGTLHLVRQTRKRRKIDEERLQIEAAVVGQPDPVLGEQPVAFVVLRHGQNASPADLIEYSRASLARYKVPREVCIEKALPKNAIGNVDKRALRERLHG